MLRSLIFLLLILAIAKGNVYAKGNPFYGEVRSASSPAWVITESGQKKRAVKGMTLKNHESIASGNEGGMEVALPNGDIIGIVGKTEIQVNLYFLSPESSACFSKLKINEGTFFLQENELNPFSGSVHIATPFGIIYPLGHSIEAIITQKQMQVRGQEFIIPWPSFYQQDFYTRGHAISKEKSPANNSLLRIYLSRLNSISSPVIPFWSITGSCLLYVPSPGAFTTVQVDLNGHMQFPSRGSLFKGIGGKSDVKEIEWGYKEELFSENQILQRIPFSPIEKAANIHEKFSSLGSKQKKNTIESFLLDWSKSSYEMRAQLIKINDQRKDPWEGMRSYLQNLAFANKIKSAQTIEWVKNHFSDRKKDDYLSFDHLVRDISAFTYLNRDIFWAELELHSNQIEGRKDPTLIDKINKMKTEIQQDEAKLRG